MNEVTLVMKDVINTYNEKIATLTRELQEAREECENLRAELEAMTRKWQDADAKMWAIVAESKSDTEAHGPFSPLGPVRPEDGISGKGEK